MKECNGERDHVHLLVHYPPNVAASKLVNSLKGVSARRIRQEFTAGATAPSCTGTCGRPRTSPHRAGGAPLATVRQYIDQQQRPH
ncbi:IS200/IS605 family transposase [Streptomyces decoyicus]|uniref:IS200/IS605 family transposase n=1 Tax=Streptomyces decoyicus TaxID=249567 RepID=UPI0033FB6760